MCTKKQTISKLVEKSRPVNRLILKNENLSWFLPPVIQELVISLRGNK